MINLWTILWTVQKKYRQMITIKNQAQNNGFGRFDGVDDTLHTKVREHLANGKTLKCHHKNCVDKEYQFLR